MSDEIFLINDDGTLVGMSKQPYDTEGILQGLLEQYPQLIPGAQISADRPRRWLLIAREVAVADDEGAGGRWAVDHLFVDQDATPTIIEVKRSTDTRIRREVVGQLLEYGANAIAYWPIEQLRADFERTCDRGDKDPDAVLQEFLGVDADREAFWESLRLNLRAGKVRLLFVADQIPPELRRIVEFLNEQMSPAEVLAVEVPQFVGEGIRSLVPRVVGQVGATEKKSGTRKKRKWDETSFLAQLRDRYGEGEVAIAKRLLDWGEEKGLRVWWGEGAKYGSFHLLLDHEGDTYYIFSPWTAYAEPHVGLQFGSFNSKQRESLPGLVEKLNAVPGVNIAPNQLDKFPGVGFGVFGKSESLTAFLAAFDWALEQWLGSASPAQE